MDKISLDEIVGRYKRGIIHEALLVGALVCGGTFVIALMAGFVLIGVQFPPGSGIGQLLTSVRDVHHIPPEGYPLGVLFSKEAWSRYLLFGGTFAVIAGTLSASENLKLLKSLKEHASQFPAEQSIAFVSEVLLKRGGGSMRKASAELLAHAGEKGSVSLIQFLSSEFNEFEIEYAAVAVQSLGRVAIEPAIAQLERCSLEVEALLARLLAAESDRSRHSIIRGKINLYQDSLQEALVRARRNQGVL